VINNRRSRRGRFRGLTNIRGQKLEQFVKRITEFQQCKAAKEAIGRWLQDTRKLGAQGLIWNACHERRKKGRASIQGPNLLKTRRSESGKATCVSPEDAPSGRSLSRGRGVRKPVSEACRGTGRFLALWGRLGPPFGGVVWGAVRMGVGLQEGVTWGMGSVSLPSIWGSEDLLQRRNASYIQGGVGGNTV